MPYSTKKRTLLFFMLFLCFTVLIPAAVTGQATGNPREDFLYGEYYLNKALYGEALTFYLSSLEKQPGNANLNFRVGLCYSKMIGDQHEALPYLQKAISEVKTHYVEGKYSSSASPIEAWLLLGDAYLRDDNLGEASKAYHEYKNLLGNSDEMMYKEVMRRISGLGVSYEFQRENLKICLMNFGEDINSRFSDYNPVVSGDQKVIVYSQYWDTYDKILITRLIDNRWTVPEDISPQIETEGVCYTSAISFDGNELYLVCHDEKNYDLYVSVYENGKWSRIKELQGKINSRYRESSVCVSSDGNTLYFASDRPGGIGGFDIYKAEKEGDEWVNIENLGKSVNTRVNEEAPYISSDGTVLYFSSNGHESVGNMDIMYSELDEGLTWLSPINIGVPVNTTNDDLFYSYFKDTKTGYLSRDIAPGSGKNDIYMVQYGECPELVTGYIVEPQFYVKGIGDTEIPEVNSGDLTSATLSANKIEINKTSEVSPEETSAEKSRIDSREETGLIITYQTARSSSDETNEANSIPEDNIADNPSNYNKAEIKQETEYQPADSYSELKTTDNNLIVEKQADESPVISQNIQPGINTSENDKSDPETDIQSANTFSELKTTDNNLIVEKQAEESHVISQENIQPGTYNTKNSEVSENQSEKNQKLENIADNSKGKEQKRKNKKASEKTDKNETIELTENNQTINVDPNTSVTDYNYIDKQLEAALNAPADTHFSSASDSLPIYTIQVYALYKPMNIKKIKLSPLKVSLGPDGLYRYTFGEYTGYSTARKKLDEMWNSGYPDAFIRNISTVPNYTQ
jgi:hypothetical protein